jgi:hypothetical protein
VLSLNGDGTGKMEDTPIKFTVKGSTLVIEEGGEVNRYGFVQKGNALTLSGGDLDRPMTFERQGATAPTGLGARRAQAAAEAAPAEAGGKRRGGIVGLWQGPNGLVDIREATIVIGNESFPYTANGAAMTVTTKDGPLQVPYQLQGDVMNVVFLGQPQTLKRAAPAAKRAGSGGVPAELAGKWCYFAGMSANGGGGRMTDECFTLYPNGTYDYHRESSASAYAPGVYGGTASQSNDSGTWTATDTRMNVSSRAAGTLSYQLEKRNHPKNTSDPMLCLDGKCFVTATQRPPWR